MNSFLQKAGGWLHRRAENVLAALLAVLFVAFIVQIVFRYFLNFPIGWTAELSVICWLWLVLWGVSFVAKESDEIRFDILSGAVGPRTGRAMGIVTAIAIVGLYAAAIPATYKYISFMKVEKSSYLHVRLDVLYSAFGFYVIAVIVRYLWILWQLLRGTEPAAGDPGPRKPGA